MSLSVLKNLARQDLRNILCTTQTVFFGLESDNTKTMSVGHLKNYTKVLVPIDLELRGCKAEVEIEKGER